MNGWTWPREVGAQLKTRPPAGTPFRQNVALLLSCFGFAIILWMYVAGLEPDQDPGQTSTRVVSVPIRYLHATMPVHESDVASTSVTLQGPTGSLEHPVRATVDLAGVRKPGNYLESISIQAADPDVMATTVIPDHVHVFLDYNRTVVLPVAWHSINHPPPGYVAGVPIISPDTVSVSGPSTLISKIRASTQFDLSNITGGVDMMPAVLLTGVPDGDAHLFSVTPEKVRLFLPIQRQIAYATLPVSLRWLGGLPDNVLFERADVTPPAVTISGAPGILQGLSTVPTASIPLSGVHRNFTERVPLDPPEGVHVEGEPSVEVHVEVLRSPVPAISPPQPPTSLSNPANRHLTSPPSDAQRLTTPSGVTPTTGSPTPAGISSSP